MRIGTLRSIGGVVMMHRTAVEKRPASQQEPNGFRCCSSTSRHEPQSLELLAGHPRQLWHDLPLSTRGQQIGAHGG